MRNIYGVLVMNCWIALGLGWLAGCASEVGSAIDAATGQTQSAVTAPFKVVLTFDDTFAEQATLAAPALEARGMRGTFFVNSPRLGTAGYMTLGQVQAMQAAGHEIGGHTLTHPHLPALTTAQQQHEICDDRSALIVDGLSVSSFAYPFGDDNAAVQAVVAGCGYARGRDIGGANNLAGFCGSTISCTTCAYGETVPARTPMSIRTAPTSAGPHVAGAPCNRQDLYAAVNGAEYHAATGPVLVINFHHVCDGCDPTLGFPVADFNAFLDWLVATGVQTQTLAQAFP